MGDVFLAEDPTLRRRVAIKVLAEFMSADPGMLRRFVDEAVAASALTHPNVAVVYEATKADDGCAYIAMEYVEGDTLLSRLSHGPLPIDDCVRIARQIADALDDAHRRGIVHRDIKPANIMIDERGRVKVLDFGIAKLTNHAGIESNVVTSPLQTAQGVVIGTAQYMSPEQAAGERVDNRSDLFSLGIVLYEMITGRNPFAAPTMGETFARIREAQAPPPSSLRPQTPRELDRIVKRCLDKDRHQRYQSARDIVLDLEHIGERPKPSRARAVVIAVIAVAAIAAAGLWSLRPSSKRNVAPPRKQIRSIAVLPFVNMSTDASNGFIADGMTEEIINALAQVPSLQVVSRTSVFAFKGQNADIRTIGEKLGVSSVVEGSVQRSGGRLRITAQLISVEDGYHLWSDRYDRSLDDVFAVEDEIARAVAVALRTRIGAPAAAQVPTHDIVAYEAYVKARQAASTWTRPSFDRALELYGLAVARDPNFAAAHAGLAELYSLMDHAPHLTSLPSSETYRLSIEEAQKALAIDPDSSEAQSALGHILIHSGKLADADEHLSRSVVLNPNNVMGHLWLSVLRRAQGRIPETKAESRAAMRLDPLNEQVAAVVSTNLVGIGEYQLAAGAARLGLKSDPNYGKLYTLLGRAEMFSGHFAEAHRALEQADRATQPANDLREVRALLLAVEGKNGEALAALRRIEQQGDGQPETMMLAYAAAGDDDLALRCAERLARQRPNYARIGLDLSPHPAFDRLRNDPRYLAIRRSISAVE